MYMASFNSTIVRYRELLSEQNAGRLKCKRQTKCTLERKWSSALIC